METKNVVKVAEDADFGRVKEMCEEEMGWTLVYQKKSTRVWTKPASQSTFHMIKVRGEYNDVSAALLYDVLHDSDYRKHWDKYMNTSKIIGLINPNNDICYYAVRSPPPLKCRDLVFQRSWLDLGSEMTIFSHSVCHDDFPPQRGYIRATNYLTAYFIRSLAETKCQVTYFAHGDPKGHLPSIIVNRITQILTPKMIKRLHKACQQYDTWKASQSPNWKPWLTPSQQTDLPRIDLNKCLPRNYNTLVDEKEEEEEEEENIGEDDVRLKFSRENEDEDDDENDD